MYIFMFFTKKPAPLEIGTQKNSLKSGLEATFAFNHQE
jgi:hypothetical protein